MEEREGHDTHESRVRDEAEDLPNQETESERHFWGSDTAGHMENTLGRVSQPMGSEAWTGWGGVPGSHTNLCEEEEGDLLVHVQIGGVRRCRAVRGHGRRPVRRGKWVACQNLSCDVHCTFLSWCQASWWWRSVGGASLALEPDMVGGMALMQGETGRRVGVGTYGGGGVVLAPGGRGEVEGEGSDGITRSRLYRPWPRVID